jgi:hypothetical protein
MIFLAYFAAAGQIRKTPVRDNPSRFATGGGGEPGKTVTTK